jgi:hypothetical protein
LNGKTVETLRQSYQFFRVLIDELRVVHGHARDLEIPAPETRELALLARRMRSANATALLASIESQRGATRGAVEQLAALLGRA